MSADRFAEIPDRPRTRPRRRVPVYYDRNGITVTGHHLTVGTTRWPLAQLSHLARARPTTHPGVVAGVAALVVEPLVLAPLAGVVNIRILWLLLAVALVVPVLVGGGFGLLWPKRYELVARYQGSYQVILFATRDSDEFGQVARAVQRAIDARYGE